jgi:phage terminase large subunit GpA-like protein
MVRNSISTLRPPPRLTVSEWADLERRLSSEASAAPGRWYTERTEYLRGIMDAASDPNVTEIVVMAGAQLGKTEVILNVIGYHVAHDPAPILVVQPTGHKGMAETFSKDRLAPMLRDTPCLKGKVKDPRSRDSGNTTLQKNFPGGRISMIGANSPAQLASRPIRIVLLDEVDRYPASSGSEGDPIELARKRSATFWNRKVVMVSTPTNKGASIIEERYQQSDQRRFFAVCPHCDEAQTLEWRNVKWQKDRPETAGYMCEGCGVLWSDADRNRAVKAGYWDATQAFKGIAGFQISAIYSPWVSLEEAVRDFLKAKKLPEMLKVWTNTYLGETFEIDGDGVDDQDIPGKNSFDGTSVPEDVVIITAGIDVQDDRIEMEVVGHGRDQETWSLDYKTLYGDPSSPQVWGLLDAALAETWDHPSGIELPIRCACIDSGGHHTGAVYNFVKPREGRRVFAIKGMGGEGKPIVGKPSKNNRQSVRLFPVGVDGVKEMIYSRLKIRSPGPGFCHFPEGRPDEFFAQLSAEKMVTRYRKGYKRREWVQTRPRNEALDCRVYAIAALAILNLNVNSLANRFAAKAAQSDDEEPETIEPQVTPQARPSQRPVRRQGGGGFVNAWR